MPSRILLIAFILSILLPVGAAAQDQSNQQSEQPSNSSQPTAAPETPPTRIRVGGNVMVANITKMVKPVYPDIAKRASICGTDRLPLEERRGVAPLANSIQRCFHERGRYHDFRCFRAQGLQTDSTDRTAASSRGAPAATARDTGFASVSGRDPIGALSGSDGGDAQGAFLKQLSLPLPNRLMTAAHRQRVKATRKQGFCVTNGFSNRSRTSRKNLGPTCVQNPGYVG